MNALDSSFSDLEFAALAPVQRHWGWLLTVGIASMLLGLAGLSSLVLLTLTSTALFGVLLLVVGAMQLGHAFDAAPWKARMGCGLLGMLYVLAAGLVFADPLAASVWLTLGMAAFLIAGAVVRLTIWMRMHGTHGRGWLLASALISGVLGIAIAAGWPSTGLWFIGLAVGMELVFGGAFWVAVALRARRLADAQSNEDPA